MNYQKIDEDMTQVDPNYKVFKGADEADEQREPSKILESFVNQISKKFESFDHFCKVVD